MVGSILTSVEEGQEVERADELGYFAFGESPRLIVSLSLTRVQVDRPLCACLKRAL